ncbi:type II toxin-antitoxin system RelE/ParE family toxin [Flavobacterium sp. MXW15]|uniref:Type II toxin-antitoxin system RelE/ParE family toxin n=1 Tax=Xanthomonas chitinilytica TaxID=2989819 RepID=A0ABT3JTZ7_9XANT|nr:type II toxin-antitoxin system RelE/ParE family toxin [Xanthomonas sp. H13-6]MCW4454707.1 type II toxin-antitoxin system RelE/ParE family toxin [Flavobacterium sp. MXW15]MCW4471946.1 type II toxin-antitoxin system RelE/ParE family toxin [Xanthomonas sp. H13-6]
MSFRIRFTEEAEDDLLRLYDYLLERSGVAPAADALAAIRHAMELLAFSPFSCRKVDPANPFLRELIIGHGVSGYVALFEIEDQDTVTILAIRHQREEDYH